MKKQLLPIMILFVIGFANTVNAQNPVPNPGFENWTTGNPDGWFVNNIPGFAVPITQATPPHNGSFALKGEVVSTLGGDIVPVIASMDMNFVGFPITQAFATLSFYYKFNKVTTGIFGAFAAMYENGAGAGAAAQEFTSSVTSFTQANIPVYYSSFNPDTCIIEFVLTDTVLTTPAIGNYFIIDDVALSGLVGVQEQQAISEMSISKVQPNPVNDVSYIYYSIPQQGDIQFALYDISGKTYKTINVPMETAGKHKIELDAADIPAGFYILRMTSVSGYTTAKVQVVK